MLQNWYDAGREGTTRDHRDLVTLIRKAGHAFGYLWDLAHGNKTQASVVRLQSDLGPGNMMRSQANHLSSVG